MQRVTELCKLCVSSQLQNVMLQIDKYSKILRKPTDIVGAVESDPEYQLIIGANNLAAKIDDEIGN